LSIVRRWHRRKATNEVRARTRTFGAAGAIPDDEEIRTVLIGPRKKRQGPNMDWQQKPIQSQFLKFLAKQSLAIF
jgi:hypothetical protein